MIKTIKKIGKTLIQYLPSKLSLQLQYRYLFHRKLHLANPQAYSEKLQWLKLYYHPKEYIDMVDKYAVKSIVAKIIGEEHVIPLIGCWEHVEDIPWGELPNRFVLKTTNGCSNEGVVICRDKGRFDISKACQKLNCAMKQNKWRENREWHYRHVHPRIIAEQYMEDQYGELRDYKFFCFDGEVKALYVASERQSREEPYFNFFDAEYNQLPMQQVYPVNPVSPPKPKCFEQMKELARKLSAGLPHVRVDLYDVDGKVYFGEYTFYHLGGEVPMTPDKWDYTFGSWLKLPEKKI